MRRDVRMTGKCNLGVCWMQQVVGVHGVDDVDVVARGAQRVRQPIDVHRVAAEAVGRIESGQVEKVEWTTHRRLASLQTSARATAEAISARLTCTQSYSRAMPSRADTRGDQPRSSRIRLTFVT